MNLSKLKTLGSILVVLFVSLSPSDVHAQYACTDIPTLQQILSTLQTSCGQGGSTQNAFCRANGMVGTTVQAALTSCYQSTAFTQAQCEADLTCSPSFQFCRANGRVGTTLQAALDLCYQSTSFTQAQCEASVTCQGGISFCRANGRTGATVQEALDKCYQSTAFTQAQCSASLVCY